MITLLLAGSNVTRPSIELYFSFNTLLSALI
nr:MAG TPA: hypothetical protein [Caudoviricetes sp.]